MPLFARPRRRPLPGAARARRRPRAHLRRAPPTPTGRRDPRRRRARDDDLRELVARGPRRGRQPRADRARPGASDGGRRTRARPDLRDVVLTRDEISGLMAGLLVSHAPPLGRIAFSDGSRSTARRSAAPTPTNSPPLRPSRLTLTNTRVASPETTPTTAAHHWSATPVLWFTAWVLTGTAGALGLVSLGLLALGPAVMAHRDHIGMRPEHEPDPVAGRRGPPPRLGRRVNVGSESLLTAEPPAGPAATATRTDIRRESRAGPEVVSQSRPAVRQ